MSKRPIILLPDPVLRRTASPIERVDDDLRRLADDMLETMYAAPGVGLAAPQVNVSRRMIVMDIAGEGEQQRPVVMINPVILSYGNERKAYEEGCLSIPDVKVEIERPSSLEVTFLDRDGKSQTLQAEGLLATVIQHEVDHLDGRMIIDFLTRLKRDIIVRRFRKQARTDDTA